VAINENCAPQIIDGLPGDLEKFVFCEPEEFMFNYEENKFFDGFVGEEEDFNSLDLPTTTPESLLEQPVIKQEVEVIGVIPSTSTSSTNIENDLLYNFHERMLSEESFYIPNVLASKVQQLISYIEKTEQSTSFTQSKKLPMKSYCLLSSCNSLKLKNLHNSSLEDTIVYASQSFFQMTGFKPNDVLGRKCDKDHLYWAHLADQNQVNKKIKISFH